MPTRQVIVGGESMNGFECLKEEMMKRGLTKQQTETKAVATAVSILAENEEFLDLSETIKDLKITESNIINNIAYQKSQCRLYEMKASDCESRLKRQEADYREYIESFNKSLLECETPEGRDAMRTAQLFINSVDVDTKYDNTAFIMALATILTGGKFNGMEELKKINTKLPYMTLLPRGAI